MSNTVIATKKIKLIVEGGKEEKSRVFDVIRQGMIDQNNAMNLYISTLYAEKMAEKKKAPIPNRYSSRPVLELRGLS